MDKIEINDGCYGKSIDLIQDGIETDITDLKKEDISAIVGDVVIDLIINKNIDPIELVTLLCEHFGEWESTGHCEQCGHDSSVTTYEFGKNEG